MADWMADVAAFSTGAATGMAGAAEEERKRRARMADLLQELGVRSKLRREELTQQEDLRSRLRLEEQRERLREQQIPHEEFEQFVLPLLPPDLGAAIRSRGGRLHPETLRILGGQAAEYGRERREAERERRRLQNLPPIIREHLGITEPALEGVGGAGEGTGGAGGALEGGARAGGGGGEGGAGKKARPGMEMRYTVPLPGGGSVTMSPPRREPAELSKEQQLAEMLELGTPEEKERAAAIVRGMARMRAETTDAATQARIDAQFRNLEARMEEVRQLALSRALGGAQGRAEGPLSVADLSKVPGAKPGMSLRDLQRSGLYPIPPEMRKDLITFQAARQMFDRLFVEAKRLLTAKGGTALAAQATQAQLAESQNPIVGTVLGQWTKWQKDYRAYIGLLNETLPNAARAFGERGVLTEFDIQRVIRAFPTAGDARKVVIAKIENLQAFLNATRAAYDQAIQKGFQDMSAEDPGWAARKEAMLRAVETGAVTERPARFRSKIPLPE